MNFGIDISQIAYVGTGVMRFTKGLVNTICEKETKHHWTFFYSSLRKPLDSQIQSLINQTNHSLVKLPLPPTFLSFLWNDLHVLAIDAIVQKLDYFITSDWTQPPTRCKNATIIHDLVYLRNPKTVHPNILETQKKRMNWVKKETSLIFADSKATKNDIVSLLQIESDKVIVNYPGFELPENINIGKKRILQKLDIYKPFVLSVGKFEPRKNFNRLIEAFGKLKRKDIELVIVGPKGWEDKKETNDSIRFLGYVSDDELTALYQSCLCFALPSLWEGFGYPVLEAMANNAAVLTSNNSSMQEIAGDAAVLVDPYNTQDISDKLSSIITNPDLLSDLKTKGLDRYKLFSWNKYYSTLIDQLTRI